MLINEVPGSNIGFPAIHAERCRPLSSNKFAGLRINQKKHNIIAANAMLPGPMQIGLKLLLLENGERNKKFQESKDSRSPDFIHPEHDGEAAREFVVAKQNPLTLQGFVNTFLCQTWSDPGTEEEIPYEYLFSRREDSISDHELVAPEGTALVTCGVDIQDDRAEIEFVAWGKGQAAPENWSLHYGVLYGDPSGQKFWDQLDALLLRSWTLPNGRSLGVSATCIDSGGHYTASVYAFVKGRQGRRIFAIKDRGEEGRPPIPNRPSRNNIGKVPLYVLGSFALKEQVLGQLRIEEPGPGFCHFPDTRPREYFLGLLSEKIVTKYGRGYAKKKLAENQSAKERTFCL